MTLFFKILAAVVLAVLLFLMWIILVPRNFWVEFSKRDGFIVKMNIAFFKVSLYPLPQLVKKKTEKAGENEKPTGKQKEKENPFENIQLSFDLVKQVVSATKGIMKRVFRALKFRDVSFTVPVYAGDIHNTQKAYAAATTAFYSLSVFLQKHLQLYYKSPVFVADFANQYSDSTYFYCKITASPVLLLTAAYFAYTQYIEITTDNKKAEQAPEKEIKNG